MLHEVNKWLNAKLNVCMNQLIDVLHTWFFRLRFAYLRGWTRFYRFRGPTAETSLLFLLLCWLSIVSGSLAAYFWRRSSLLCSFSWRVSCARFRFRRLFLVAFDDGMMMVKRVQGKQQGIVSWRKSVKRTKVHSWFIHGSFMVHSRQCTWCNTWLMSS